jgi:hypothetical protein
MTTLKAHVQNNVNGVYTSISSLISIEVIVFSCEIGAVMNQIIYWELDGGQYCCR